MSLQYPKIETLFERKEDFSVDTSKLKKSVIATISEWDVTEKIDGANIRIMISEEREITFGGRTDNANIPADLLNILIKTFDKTKVIPIFGIKGQLKPVVLYGEGYGAGIQKGGGNYRVDKSFILFDVLIDGKWWLDRAAIESIAKSLRIDTVPYLGRMTLNQIIDLVKKPFPSRIGTAISEGIVARPIETLFDKHGDRLIIKLKTRDFFPNNRNFKNAKG
jgi:hypothetical protein